MNISKITDTKGGVFTIGMVVGISVGSVVGYILGGRRKEALPQDGPIQMTIFDVDTPEETAEVLKIVQASPDEDTNNVIELINKEVLEERNMVDYSKSTPPKRKPTFIPIEPSEVDSKPAAPLVNVFTSKATVWDYDKEIESRSKTSPYVIHQDEFVSDEMGFKQETVTYYAEDDILADETDTPMYNYSSMLGKLKFGHGSNDKNVVYIRNEVIRMEYEVLLHRGSFAYEVLGQELGEGEKEPIRKFRQE